MAARRSGDPAIAPASGQGPGRTTGRRTRGLLRTAACRAPLALLALAAFSASGTEGGGNSYPMGVETNYNGLMLPEGAHWFVYDSHYGASHSKNGAGQDNPQLVRFHLSANVIAPRLSYVWPGVSFLGAHIETRVVQAFVESDLDAAAARPGGLSPLDRGGRRSGLADMAFSPVILGWHSPSYHQTVGIDSHLKTGTYDVAERVNTGRNYAQLAFFYAFTWFPAPGFDVNAKLRYATNERNRATAYRSGNEATVEFSGGWRIAAQLTLGINGYLYRQTTDDDLNGRPVNGNGNRGRVNAIGPYLNYDLTPHLALVAKLQQEFGARNKPQGTRLWLQARVPF